MVDHLPHHFPLQEGELELEAEPAKADMTAHSETLRDTAPVLEGIKVSVSKPTACEISRFVKFVSGFC